MTCTWILLVTFLCGISQAYFNNARSPFFAPPRYESCKESIEDLKALVEITQCLKPEPCVCPVCTSTLSEEVIIKLVNALIYTVTHTCGLNGKEVCGVPIHNGGTGSGNNGGGNTDGGNTGGGNTGGANTGGGNTGGGNTGGRNSGGGNTGGGNTGSAGENLPLINAVLLDDQDTAHVDLAGQKVLGVDVGPQKNHTTDGLVQVGVLDKKNSLANVGLGGNDILNVGLGGSGTPSGSGTSKRSSKESSTTPTATVQTTIHPTMGTQQTSPTQSNNGSGTNNSLGTTATGVNSKQSVLSGNTGDVGSVNNTVVNNGAGAANTSIRNTTAESS